MKAAELRSCAFEKIVCLSLRFIIQLQLKTIVNDNKGIIYLYYAVVTFQHATQVGRTSFSNVVDEHASLVQTVRYTETEIFVHRVFEQSDLQSRYKKGGVLSLVVQQYRNLSTYDDIKNKSSYKELMLLNRFL